MKLLFSAAQLIGFALSNPIQILSEGSHLTHTWEHGATGNVFWPNGTSCGYSFTINFGCELDGFYVGAGSDQVTVSTSDNTEYNVYVSEKHLNQMQFLSYNVQSQNCNFSAVTDDTVTFATFNGYSTETSDISVIANGAWISAGAWWLDLGAF